MNQLKDITLLENTNQSLYSNLVQSKMLIDDECDELSIIKNKVNLVDNDKSSYNLIINPTLDCNFHCWYCYESHIKKSKLDIDNIVRVKKLINNIITTQDGLTLFKLNYFGGEPLLRLDIIKQLSSYTKELCFNNKIDYSMGMTSNGYLLNSSNIPQLLKLGLQHIQITLDGNKSFHDKIRYASKRVSSYEKIMNNIKELVQNDINIIIRINYTPENLAGCGDIVDDLELIEQEFKKNIEIRFHQVWQTSDQIPDEDILHSIIKRIVEKGFKVTVTLLQNISSSCYADKRYGSLINFNGDVFKCTAQDFMYEQRAGYLNDNGEIVWENDSLEKRMNSKFKNKSCLTCRILPICNGGCSQKALYFENTDYCLCNYSEDKKDKAILDIFYYNMRFNKSWQLQ